MTDAFADLSQFVTESEPWFRDQLKTLVEQPTVSPGKLDDAAILAGVEVAARLMASTGAQVEVVPTRGTPSLIARFGHPNPAARVVVYNHFDVQPADASKWDQPDPFGFEVRSDPAREFLYLGRGTTDDKGPALCALRAAEWVARHELPIEVVCLWETEEEIGSPHFEDVLHARKDLLAGDCVIVSDTVWPSAETPAISVGLRGGMLATLTLRTGTKEVHSGLAGGVARNPVRELAALANAIDQAAFWRLDAVDPSADELASFMRSGFETEYFKASHQLDKLRTELPIEMMVGLWSRPTFEAHAIAGGYQGRGVKSTIADVAELKVSFRLVPEQLPDRLFARLEQFVQLFNPDVEIARVADFAPYRGHTEGPIHDAIVHGMQTAFGKPPALVREGGSIGAVPKMATLLGVPIHFLPLSLPEHGYHSPNERFDWKQGKGGIAAFVHTFARLARVG
jgi:acetylornithine deacetylase/succinyl-diaminopimelate desuccinylase-like protein